MHTRASHNLSQVTPVFPGLTPSQSCSLKPKAMTTETDVQFIHGELRAVKSGSLILYFTTYVRWTDTSTFPPVIGGKHTSLLHSSTRNSDVCEVVCTLMFEFQKRFLRFFSEISQDG